MPVNLEARDLTADELRGSRLQDETLQAVWAQLVSDDGKHYMAIHVPRHPNGPYILLSSRGRDRDDFVRVRQEISELVKGKPEGRGACQRVGGVMIAALLGIEMPDLRSEGIWERTDDICGVIRLGERRRKLTQSEIADAVEKLEQSYQGVTIAVAHWGNVPADAPDTYQGLPRRKLSFVGESES